MSLPKIDYRMPITIPILAVHPQDGRITVVKADVLWGHVLGIEDHPFPDMYPKIMEEYRGICNMRLTYGNYIVVGPFIQYHTAWSAYRHRLIEEEKLFKLNLSAN